MEEKSSKLRSRHVFAVLIGLILLLLLKHLDLDAEDWQSLAEALQRMG